MTPPRVDSAVSAPPRSRRRLDWRAVLGMALSVGFLWLALRGVRFRTVAQNIAAADPWLFLAAVAVTTFTFWIRAWRWRSLIRPVNPDTAFRNRFPAVVIGYMAINLLPARAGELVRAYVLSRREPVPLVTSLGSLVVEHMIDGLMLVALTFVALAWPSFPAHSRGGEQLHHLASLLALVFGSVAVACLALVIWPRAVVAAVEWLAARVLPAALRRPLVGAMASLLAALGAIRQPLLLLRVLLWSVALWLVGALSYWLGMLAFGIHLPYLAAIFLQSVVAFAVAIPSSPGFLGVFEAGARFGLVQVWGVDATRAVSYAIGFHIGGYIPVTLMGLFYVWRLGMTWKQVGRRETPEEDAAEGTAAQTT